MHAIVCTRIIDLKPLTDVYETSCERIATRDHSTFIIFGYLPLYSLYFLLRRHTLYKQHISYLNISRLAFSAYYIRILQNNKNITCVVL
jgi:hypothetical protein